MVILCCIFCFKPNNFRLSSQKCHFAMRYPQTIRDAGFAKCTQHYIFASRTGVQQRPTQQRPPACCFVRRAPLFSIALCIVHPHMFMRNQKCTGGCHSQILNGSYILDWWFYTHDSHNSIHRRGHLVTHTPWICILSAFRMVCAKKVKCNQ